MKISFLLKEEIFACCCYFENMKRMLSFERNIHTISTIRVNFEWTKHIRQLEKFYKNLQEDFAQFNLIMVQSSRPN